MLAPLLLTPDMMITDGRRVKDREARRKLSLSAMSNAEVRRLRECRERMA